MMESPLPRRPAPAAGSPPRRWSPALLAPGLFALGPIVYNRMLRPGWAPGNYDMAVYFYQLRHYLALAWSQGRWLPLWNQDYYLGVPFLANIQTAPLFPP